MVFFFDPLEQFDMLSVLPMFFAYLPTNLNMIFFFNLVLIWTFMNISLQKNICVIESKYSYSFNINFWVLVNMYEMIFGILNENIALKKKSFIVLVFYLFLFLLFSNLVGMMPFSYTMTSSLILTFFLSSGFFIGLNLIGFYHNKSSIFKTFLPGGSPILMAPLLMLIEVISYFSRIFSLSIRLFANMMSGHALLKILMGFSWVAFVSNCHFFNLMAFLPYFVVSAALILELAIAGLQAYVFTVLICIYMNDAINPH